MRSGVVDCARLAQIVFPRLALSVPLQTRPAMGITQTYDNIISIIVIITNEPASAQLAVSHQIACAVLFVSAGRTESDAGRLQVRLDGCAARSTMYFLLGASSPSAEHGHGHKSQMTEKRTTQTLL